LVSKECKHAVAFICSLYPEIALQLRCTKSPQSPHPVLAQGGKSVFCDEHSDNYWNLLDVNTTNAFHVMNNKYEKNGRQFCFVLLLNIVPNHVILSLLILHMTKDNIFSRPE
jgi:hypothetical protein